MRQRAEGQQAMAGMRRWWWLILLFAVVGGTAGHVVSKEIEPVFQATTTLLVGDLTDAPSLTKDDIQASRVVASTYRTLIRRQPVLESVIQELGLSSSWQELKNQVRVDIGTADTHLIAVAAFASSPAQARAIAEAVADQAIAVSPSGMSDQADAAYSFASSQVRELEETMAQGERRVAMLEAALASARTRRARARLQSQIEERVNLVIGWQRSYASLLKFLSPDGSPNTLHVLEPSEAIAARIRPDLVVNTGLGAAIGASIGLEFTHRLALRRARRGRHAIGRGPRERAGLSAAPSARGYPAWSPSEYWVDETPAVDPWVRELTDSPGEDRARSARSAQVS